MARLFLLLAILLAIFWWLGSRVRSRRAEPPPADAGGAHPDANPDANPDATRRAQEPMVPCAHCGVHLPRSEAIAYQGLHYCRAGHLPEAQDRSGDRGDPSDRGDRGGPA